MITIKRDEGTGHQTLGTLTVTENYKLLFECKTLELPFINNTPQISCIPYAEYDCEKSGPTAGIPYPHIVVLNVPNREGIAIHKANYYKQLRGCIAVGDKHVDINKDGNLDVTNSGTTFDKLMAILPNNFKLIIK